MLIDPPFPVCAFPPSREMKPLSPDIVDPVTILTFPEAVPSPLPRKTFPEVGALPLKMFKSPEVNVDWEVFKDMTPDSRTGSISFEPDVITTSMEVTETLDPSEKADLPALNTMEPTVPDSEFPEVIKMFPDEP